jgi:hypothetical protein
MGCTFYIVATILSPTRKQEVNRIFLFRHKKTRLDPILFLQTAEFTPVHFGPDTSDPASGWLKEPPHPFSLPIWL